MCVRGETGLFSPRGHSLWEPDAIKQMWAWRRCASEKEEKCTLAFARRENGALTPQTSFLFVCARSINLSIIFLLFFPQVVKVKKQTNS